MILDTEKLDINLSFLDDGTTNNSSTKQEKTQVGSKNIRPWVRYFARTIDVFLFSILFAVVLTLAGTAISDMPDILFVLLNLFVWIFFEAILLSTIGTTPGKWLLKTRIKDNDGNKLSFLKAIRRCIAVWLYGLGMGIPLITLLASISGHSDLTKRGITSWDKKGGFIISHGNIGFFRALVDSLILILMLYFMILGKME